ncbi:acyltransferase family protein [Hymenobacter cheonanensis]|uniref:acyltransferase family protein n=1 Tax=Hymenobacter sp. CA2-7 TaxID=3063993 RepID=UPI002712B8BB|nr:acyltransferase family protein [Hymenobacter sp. CA2-7]MDO7887212.1 hypothetical protein [Hymenobacter sp. CA2-7]
MRKYYSGITVFKLVGSLTVLLAHIKLPSAYLALTYRVAGLAQMMAVVVPCFYMVSGFLAYQGWTRAASPGTYIRRYLLWISAVYALFCGYYLATTTLPALIGNYQAHVALGGPVRLLFDVFFLQGPAYSLWFVPPLLAGIGTTYFFERRGWFRAVCLLALAGFGFAQLTYGPLRVLAERLGQPVPWCTGRHALLVAKLSANYLGIGFPAVVAGAWVARHETVFLGMRARWLALGAAGLLVAETWFLWWATGGHYSYTLVFSMAPISLLLFLGVLRLEAPGIRAYHTLINRFSMVVFFAHVLLIRANYLVLNCPALGLAPGQELACVVLTLLESVALTLLLTHYLARRSQRAAPAPALALANYEPATQPGLR